jgi:hypothetical protein
VPGRLLVVLELGMGGVTDPFASAAIATASVPGQGYEGNGLDEQRAPALSLPSSDSFASYPQEAMTAWPTLDPAALTGLAGRVVEVLSPHTEADPAALLLTFLAAFGNLAGRGPHAVADGADHPARLNVVLVGDTSRSRKGTAWANIRKLLEQADPDWYDECVVPGGLSTGEGLIAAVRDVDGDDEGEAPDKRRLVMEPEFARVLAVAAREGNTLSAVLRSAWDDGRLRVLTRKDPLQATGAHISIVGHITTEELVRRLADTEVANGFANRLLFTCVRPVQAVARRWPARPGRPRPPGRACRPLRQAGADHRAGASLPSGRLALAPGLPPIRGWSWGTGRRPGRPARGPDPSPVGGVRAAGRLGGHRA